MLEGVIDEFKYGHKWLSNFSICHLDPVDGVVPKTVEHAYQAAKFLDSSVRIRILTAATPSEARKLGQDRTLKIHDDWDVRKLVVMRDLLWQKFSTRNPWLVELLLATGNARLIEGNTWGDTYWGVCREQGQNHLGRLLMERRLALREGKA